MKHALLFVSVCFCFGCDSTDDSTEDGPTTFADIPTLLGSYKACFVFPGHNNKDSFNQKWSETVYWIRLRTDWTSTGEPESHEIDRPSREVITCGDFCAGKPEDERNDWFACTNTLSR